MGKDAFGNINNEKSFVVALWLSIIFGIFGADHFYLGKIGSGALKLLTIGGLGIWWIIDVVNLFRGKTTDKSGNPLEGYSADARKTNLLILGGLFALSIVFDSIPDTGNVAATKTVAPQAWTKTVAPQDSSCLIIEDQIIEIKSTFMEGTANATEVMMRLELAAAAWSAEAENFSGSKSEWLSHMAKLARDLNSYISTSSPSNGFQIQDQLFNNMKLYSQFCD